MFVVVGRFRFRPMGQGGAAVPRSSSGQRDFTPLARASPGFRGVEFVRLGDDEVITV